MADRGRSQRPGSLGAPCPTRVQQTWVAWGFSPQSAHSCCFRLRLLRVLPEAISHVNIFQKPNLPVCGKVNHVLSDVGRVRWCRASDTWELVCWLDLSLVEHKMLPPPQCIFCNLVVDSLQISHCYPLSTSEGMFITCFSSNYFRETKGELTWQIIG